MKKVGVAILGLGSVGRGTYEILTAHGEFFRRTQGLELVVESVLEQEEDRVSALGVEPEKVAGNIAEIVTDPDVQVVVDTFGGTDKARDYALAALKAGKTVVTSNAELYAKCSPELESAAKKHNAGLYFEGSCLGGVPAVRTLLDGVQSNEISSLAAIVSGELNRAFTRMAEEGVGYAEAVREAAGDADGLSAAYELSILASLAFHTKIPYTKVFRESAAISSEDVAAAKELGYLPKYLAVAKNTGDGVEVRVHPALVKCSHPLAAAAGNVSALCLKGDPVGEMTLIGKGEGRAVASAIVSDIVFAATHGEHRYSTYRNTEEGEDVKFSTDFGSAYYVRVTVNDEAGALAKIVSAFGKCGISVAELCTAVRNDGKATVAFVTHVTHGSAVENAAGKLSRLGAGVKVESVLRAEF